MGMIIVSTVSKYWFRLDLEELRRTENMHANWNELIDVLWLKPEETERNVTLYLNTLHNCLDINIAYLLSKVDQNSLDYTSEIIFHNKKWKLSMWERYGSEAYIFMQLYTIVGRTMQCNGLLFTYNQAHLNSPWGDRIISFLRSTKPLSLKEIVYELFKLYSNNGIPDIASSSNEREIVEALRFLYNSGFVDIGIYNNIEKYSLTAKGTLLSLSS